MTARALYDRVVMARPQADGSYVAGYFLHVEPGVWKIHFLRYRDGKGIVGHVSIAEMEKIAPKLVIEMRAHAVQLRHYLVSMEAPGGVGSSPSSPMPRRTRGGAHGCDCNGTSGSGYARNGRPAPGVGPGACAGVEGGGAGISGADGGFRAKIAPSAQREEGEGAA